MNPKHLSWLRHVVTASLCLVTACSAQTRDASVLDMPGFHNLFATNWAHGFGPAVDIQSPDTQDLIVVNDPLSPDQRAVKVSIRRSENFSHVANGTPRGEMVFARAAKIVSGREYRIEWTTLLPADFVFDDDQMQIIMQIHQTDMWVGSPPIMLQLHGSDYVFSERGGSDTRHGHDASLPGASSDRGKWVRWTLHYRPDSTGEHAVTELWKNGTQVFASRGVPNEYPQERHAYLKLGVYKPSWQNFRSKTTETGLFYGPVSISERVESSE
ncbi:heparin lyase I family protein [Paraburkholderia sp. RL17-383-BIF-A]|jgi:hypothetical protein|uniref:heparin lyase I family protein n=1 Tax=Burkholderiaceae TaxID=119060 RepID=UPI000896607D|nr:heparin lyase I family protein [Burkholderia sp. WP9]SEF00095.1 Polysaccharide lyase [Burkholderia sp. WP9]